MARKKKTFFASHKHLILVLSGATIALLAFTGWQYAARSDTPKGQIEPQTLEQNKSSVLDSMSLSRIEQSRIDELLVFTGWLERNNARGYIGEVGWPDTSPDVTGWNQLGAKWYAVAQEKDLWSSAWATGSWWGSYPLAAYDVGAVPRRLEIPAGNAGVYEGAFDEAGTTGINLAGLEFGGEGNFSNLNPGRYGQTYFSEPIENIQFLKSRGVRQMRLPFRWERLQPTLNGELSPAYLGLIRSTLDAAAQNDIKVILDLHNYGEYRTSRGVIKLGTSQLPSSALSDVWIKLSRDFKDHPALLGYGIMNEPQGLLPVDGEAPAKVWERASQDVVSAIRSVGDNTLIMVSGYEWAKLSKWTQNHSTGWIQDPMINFRYEAHHYWDSDASGRYVKSFAQEAASQ